MHPTRYEAGEARPRGLGVVDVERLGIPRRCELDDLRGGRRPGSEVERPPDFEIVGEVDGQPQQGCRTTLPRRSPARIFATASRTRSSGEDAVDVRARAGFDEEGVEAFELLEAAHRSPADADIPYEELVDAQRGDIAARPARAGVEHLVADPSRRVDEAAKDNLIAVRIGAGRVHAEDHREAIVRYHASAR